MKLKHTYSLAAVISALLLLLTALPAGAQYYTAGDEPFNSRGRTIAGDHYSVIYPEGNDSLARRYLYLFEKNRDISQAGQKIGYPYVPIMLHPNAITGRSTAAWGPKRLDIFTTPTPFSGLPLNHEEETAIRVGRLLGYMQHYDTYIFRFLQHCVAGQQSVALGVGFYPSVWQSVGDAAVHLTDITPSGPGRNGEFLMYYRAAFINGDVREYDNWRYGSYKYYTPDKTAFGYMMMSNWRFYSGNYYALGDVMHIQMRDWWDIFGVWNRSFIEALNKTPRKNWRQTVAYNTHHWYAEYVNKGPNTETTPLLDKEERLYTEFKDIVPGPKGAFATKAGMQYSKRLVYIDTTGRQHYVRPFAEETSRVISDGKGHLVWSETLPDPRWGLRSWSVIRSYNPKWGIIRNLTRRSRLFNPALTSDGKGLLAVEYPVSGGSRLVRMNLSGRKLETREAPDGGQITELAQIGETTYALVITEAGMGLYCTAVNYGGWMSLIPGQHSYLQNLIADGNMLYFVADNDGVCDIYAYNTHEGTLQKCVNSRFGSFQPAIRNGELFFSDFDNLGYHPVKTVIDNHKMAKADLTLPFLHEVAEFNARQARDNVVPMDDEESERLRSHIDTLESRPYSRIGNVINIHSWAPFYANIDRISAFSYDHIYQLASLGATVISQNQLGNAVTQLGYSYHNGFHSGHLNFNYSGLYPVFELAVDFNDRHRTDITIAPNAYSDNGIIQPYPIKYTIDTLDKPAIDAKLSVYVPLDFSRSGWKNGIIPQLTVNASNDSFSYMRNGELYYNPMMYDLTAEVRFYRMLVKSKRQLSPRLGIGGTVSGRHAIGYHNASGGMFYGYLYGYLPGITKDQTIKLSAAYQKQVNIGSTYRFLPNQASVPRGYDSRILMDYFKATFDYGIFVYLGDATWPWLYYLKRMQVVPFFDFAYDNSGYYPRNGYIYHTPDKILYSYGTDILVGTHLFRMGFELNVGVRYARTAEGANTFRIIFGTNIK